jgi:dienelactone hydrolase
VLLIGETISHYRIVAELGAGGMGVVYKAEDLKLGRFVALKFLPPQFMRDPDAKRRLFSEARAASALDHASVVPIYDIEETPDGRVFLSMAFCEGETLKQRLERGPIAPIEAARIALDIGRGLAKAHQAGIIHRDVKPGNIMLLGGGGARLLDFGIARLSRGDVTQSGTTLGTMAYMSPEQVQGREADPQSDVWSLGVVLHEMLAGRRPFGGASDYELLQAIVERAAAPIPGIPTDLAAVVSRAMEKEPSRRFADAHEMAAAIETWLQTTTASGHATADRPRSRLRAAAIAGAGLAVAIAVAGVWFWRSKDTRWARDVALPEIQRLADQDRYGEAFILASRAEAALPGDKVLRGLQDGISRPLSIKSEPDGADVSLRLIGSTGAWHSLGRTPLTGIAVPRGVFEWRFEKAGFDTVEIVRGGASVNPTMPHIESVVALPPRGSRADGMVSVAVRPGGLPLTLTGFDYNKPIPAKNYFIDRYEVTNAQFKAFVDAGGYQKREYWTEPFVRDSQALDWSTAMALFRDRTGRPGPATWEGGSPRAGTEEQAVSGVSWFEAVAYAAFRGKHLPTIYHWSYAAAPELGSSITRTSNFGSDGPRRVTMAGGLGPFGTYGMAGNVKEWVWNAQPGGGTRYILGGGWNDRDYQFLYPDQRSPFDRGETNGFRCVMYGPDGPPAALTAPVAPPSRDYSREQPIADPAYRIYAEQYVYDRTPLDARVESSDDNSAHWRHELVTIAAGYGNERLPIHLYLPKTVKPPYQTVLFFPSSGAIRTRASANTPGDAFDFVVLGGRAVMYPVYKHTFERMDPGVTSSWAEPTRAYATWIQQLATDARRAIDYAATRPEIDSSKLGYIGISWGGRLGPLMIALEPRFKTGVFMMGGLGTGAPPLAEADPFNFAPRVRVPILMLNGDQDFIFPLQTSQQPLFQALGTAAPEKQHMVYPGGHEIVGTHRSQVVQEVLAWLDRYLGRVQ